jgi:hypothetical protein
MSLLMLLEVLLWLLLLLLLLQQTSEPDNRHQSRRECSWCPGKINTLKIEPHVCPRYCVGIVLRRIVDVLL